MRVLLVENDIAAGKAFTRLFEDNRFRTELTDTGEDALELLRHYEFDIVVLSLALPDMDGTKLLTRMRTSRLSTPVLAVASRSQPARRLAVLGAGADDVVDDRIDEAELLARMRAIVRRSRGHSEATIRVGDLTLNLERREVSANEMPVPLTGKEFEVLQVLMLRRNMVLTKETILNHIYGGGADEPEIKIIDVFICKIRKRLATFGLHDVVATVWGRGYTVQDRPAGRSTPVAPPMPQPAAFNRPNAVFA